MAPYQSNRAKDSNKNNNKACTLYIIAQFCTIPKVHNFLSFVWVDNMGVLPAARGK